MEHNHENDTSLKGLQDQLNKLNDSSQQNAFMNYPNNIGVCPSCGACPTCGRRSFTPLPWWGQTW